MRTLDFTAVCGAVSGSHAIDPPELVTSCSGVSVSDAVGDLASPARLS